MVGFSEFLTILSAVCASALYMSLPRTKALGIATDRKEEEETQVPPRWKHSHFTNGADIHLNDKDDHGLLYQLYDNAVLSGSSPLYEGTTSSARLSLESPLQEPPIYDKHSKSFSSPLILSGALKGSISAREAEGRNQPFATKIKHKLDEERNEDLYQREKGETPMDSGNWYMFECVFDGTSTGWVRVGNHLVCHDGNAYHHQHPTPIPLVPEKRYAFHAILTSNTTNTPSNHNRSYHSNKRVVPSLSVYWKPYLFSGHERASKTRGIQTATNSTYSHPLDRGFRLLSSSKASLGGDPLRHKDDDDLMVLHPTFPPYEVKRQELQDRVSRGWGQWLLPDLLSLTKLPEGIVVGLQICGAPRTTTNRTDDEVETPRNCVGPVVPDSKGIVRVDRHSTDRSYVSFNLTFDDGSNEGDSESGSVSLTVEYSVSGPDREKLRCLMTITECDSCEGFVLEVLPRYAWFRPGQAFKTSDTSLSFSTPGMGTTNVWLLMDDANRESLLKTTAILQDNALAIPFSKQGQKIGLLAGPSSSHLGKNENLAQLEKHIRAMDALDESRMKQAYGPKFETAQAIRAAVMWSWIYNPIEEGPLLPVSRDPRWTGFSGRAKAASPDWNYVIFDWDNLFASLLASMFDKEIAYANLFVVVRSKTTDGFIPNYSTAGGIWQSGDRTEPPVGAKVLLELYRKYKESWIVEALWEDLVEWNDWFMRERLLEPLGLIGLGSYNDHPDVNDQNNLQAARFESGLDNSPMYDGEEDQLYDKTTHMMQMYDVGMTSLVANEAYCLAELADAIGMNSDKARSLRSRGDRLRDNIWEHLWDPTRNIFANRYRKFLPGTNSSFVRSITPTSFYPLLLPIPEGNTSIGSECASAHVDDRTLESMVGSWLVNATRFCLSPNGDFEGNDPNSCYWGLPSVSADDPTFMSGKWNYWRGLVWGPMAQIVYWSLQTKERGLLPPSLLRENNHQPAVERSLRMQRRKMKSTPLSSLSNTTKARKALCSQMEALMLSQWEKNRHICENYSPFKNATECSGTLFYHWGALNGMIGMIEEAYYNDTKWNVDQFLNK